MHASNIAAVHSPPAGPPLDITFEDVKMLGSTIKVSCADACKQQSSHNLDSSRPANRDNSSENVNVLGSTVKIPCAHACKTHSRCKIPPAGRPIEMTCEDARKLGSPMKVSCTDACKQHDSCKKLTSSRPANGDNIPREQGIPGQLLPLALAVHHDGLLGILQGSEFLQVAQPLCHHSALKHDKHSQGEEGVVPAEGARKGFGQGCCTGVVLQRKANQYAVQSMYSCEWKALV